MLAVVISFALRLIAEPLHRRVRGYDSDTTETLYSELPDLRGFQVRTPFAAASVWIGGVGEKLSEVTWMDVVVVWVDVVCVCN